MISMVFRTRRSPSSSRRGRRVRALENSVQTGGPVVPRLNVGADGGPSRGVRVKTRYLPPKGLEGAAHRLGAAEQLQQTHFPSVMTKATGRQRRPPARRPRRFVGAATFFMCYV